MASNCTDKGFIAFNAPAKPEVLKDVARRELGETEELKEECLLQLRKLIKDNNVACITTDDFLLRFLRTKKFSVQRSFEKIRNYATLRANVHRLLLNLQPQTVKKFLSHRVFLILPYCDAEERLVFFDRVGSWTTDMTSEEDYLMIIILFVSYVAEKQSSQIIGATFVHDFKYFSFTYLPFMMRRANFLKKAFFDSLPIKYAALHILNESLMFQCFNRIVSPLIPKKVKERMLYHGERREVLFQRIAPAILPDDVGGSLGPLNGDHLVEEMCDYLQKMKDEQHWFIRQKV